MKVKEIIICPSCKSDQLDVQDKQLTCNSCGDRYDNIQGKPFLLAKESDIRDSFRKILKNKVEQKTKEMSFNNYFPSPRIWSKKSLRLLNKLIKENDPRKGKKLLNMGSGSEKVYENLYREIDNDIIRIGLPHKGKIDIYGDAMNMPIKSESIDLAVSSSVFEHIKDPELAASELGRICKKGGEIYVEIPFLRGYHMEPIDYQRYTISGIEELFKRHGFELIEKGVCSGTFNALILIWLDFVRSISPPGFKKISRFFFSWTTHPFKYLDRLFENTKWNNYLACNFYYHGKKIETNSTEKVS
ncbi:class I SAM-dependent methyltransferase [Parvicella tangerina]|uniref:Methyltransferase type 11 domain-containing protein n=1 Tax=Parvicella tangerina TaxID=2829795 RepID=A0A916NSF8_9FLAO|nr:class I SAM-dependent methyltransferase [Parvicella tangerina]CAG5083713.1 hypothetical protein CRYO30217_02270 [Parvicella tangerina]